MEKSYLHVSFLALSLLVEGCISAKANVTSFAPPEYCTWLEELKKDMINRGISEETVKTVYAQDYYHPSPEVVKKDRRQIEFALTSTEYINRVVTAKRVEKAREYYKTLHPLLKQIEDKYGVPGQYIIAFWGMETNFGSNFGGYNVISSLTNLSYDKRRPTFFRNQLYEALKIIDTWNVDYTQMQGSWAGAMGHFQFMPSTFNAYAVDFDGDNKIDIWHSFVDASASAANYLSSIGWQRQIPWGMEVSLPWNFDFAQTGRNKVKNIKEWQRLGVRTKNNQKLNLDKGLNAALITPEGKKGRAYLVFDNFNKIMHWNRSENYALAIGILSDYIISNKPWRAQYENPALRLRTDDILQIQSFINKIFGDKLDEDGLLGTGTREAIKKVQQKANLPADGYPDYRLLQKIKNYNPQLGFSIPVPERKLHKPN
ncbi:MAG: lytic murein transglycosylase [Alphaproteobacteria bacterium]|nr:lytic murein transglycosylase [Alphaproteobacteria bacterium]MBQ7284939.1 lytic murein transglycosylase [Alphaproteobacteria bacterium]